MTEQEYVSKKDKEITKLKNEIEQLTNGINEKDDVIVGLDNENKNLKIQVDELNKTVLAREVAIRELTARIR